MHWRTPATVSRLPVTCTYYSYHIAFIAKLMISSLLLVLSAGSALAGVSIQMPYLNPAGVTYTTLPRAVPAIPTHLQYSAATTSSVAYGNAAFLGRALSQAAVPYAAAPVAHYAAPVTHYAAPVAHVPTVHHVPAVAQVPVTKYEAQHAVVQNLVDVAKPKLATRKIEIRRPAIQKEFYDVEERVVIRPAGSAVVELDQPVSKSQRGPTVVQPAVHAVAAVPHAYAAVRSAPVVGFRSIHHQLYPAAYPSVSVHPYPIQGPTFASPIPSPSPPQEIQQPEISQEQQGYPEQVPQQPEQFPGQNPQQQFEQQNPQQFAPQFPQQTPQQPQQFDDSDSVAVDNPDIARARAQQPQQQQSQQSEQSSQAQGRAEISPRVEQEQRQIIAEFQARMQDRADRQQDIARSQVSAQEQVVAQLQAQAQSQQAQLQRSQQLLQVQQQVLDQSRQAVDSLVRSQQNPAPLARSQPDQEEGLQSVGPANERSEFRSSFEAADLRSALINNVARSSQSPSVIPSFRISPEQSLSNQERLINLLTARGGVVEARSAGSSGESHQVRARVLSVTPAPDNASPREEKVNTRRIVVSRPIHTVEEVDVVEPFTKIERVAVHSPAVIKTARLGVAHVPTSLPVHGYAPAVTAAPIAVY